MSKLVLTILDGWGIGKTKENNAIETGSTPFWHNLIKENPTSKLITHGLDVGLPEGQMGNSEVGHLNIGAGRVVYQELPRINNSIETEDFNKIEIINESISNISKDKAIHIMGLFSDGGVHSHMSHFIHAAKIYAEANIKVYLHLFTDGRDTPPQSFISYIDEINKLTSKYSNVKVATVIGRYFAMDRDKRWERVQKAYDAMMSGTALKFASVEEATKYNYEKGIHDEFLEPSVIGDYSGMSEGDSIFMINFRSDRAREILMSLLYEEFDHFERKKINFQFKIGMVSYSDSLDQFLTTVMQKENLKNTLGEVISKNEKTQLRVAETEKYPHVTFFFSGGEEKEFKNESRLLVDSPKVATYDLKPEMSAYEITSNLCKELDTQKHDFIVVNYANGDMVGHTGSLSAASKAAEAVDTCLTSLSEHVKKNNYNWIIIADHGNCETMWDDENNVPHTQHTTNLVNMVLANCLEEGNIKLEDGRLADVSPTILEIMNIEQPSDMTGKSLLKK